jgi:hypothetical protein
MKLAGIVKRDIFNLPDRRESKKKLEKEINSSIDQYVK